MKKKAGKKTDWKNDLPVLKRMIYNELDELFVPTSEMEMGKIIGKGATSEVYIGQYMFSPVAIKKIRLGSLTHKQLVSIVNEISCLKKIRHPNIVSLYAMAIDQNQSVYLATELCEQLSIKSFFQKFKGKIPLKVKVKVIFDIAKALYHIHGHKPCIVHRDLKPENIFLTGDLKAKLGDFGYLRFLT